MVIRGTALLFSIAALSAACAQTYAPKEVARHSSKGDCWLSIGGIVYDVTGYIERHNDFDYDISRHCGADASELWQKKPETGKPHSRKATRLLHRYRIGTLQQ